VALGDDIADLARHTTRLADQRPMSGAQGSRQLASNGSNARPNISVPAAGTAGLEGSHDGGGELVGTCLGETPQRGGQDESPSCARRPSFVGGAVALVKSSERPVAAVTRLFKISEAPE
jgi:hypothetical protein